MTSRELIAARDELVANVNTFLSNCDSIGIKSMGAANSLSTCEDAVLGGVLSGYCDSIKSEIDSVKSNVSSKLSSALSAINQRIRILQKQEEILAARRAKIEGTSDKSNSQALY